MKHILKAFLTLVFLVCFIGIFAEGATTASSITITIASILGCWLSAKGLSKLGCF